jgi:hypothetical protein
MSLVHRESNFCEEKCVLLYEFSLHSIPGNRAELFYSKVKIEDKKGRIGGNAVRARSTVSIF